GIYARRDLDLRLLAGRLDGAGAVLALPAGRDAWLRSGAGDGAGGCTVVCAVAIWDMEGTEPWASLTDPASAAPSDIRWRTTFTPPSTAIVRAAGAPRARPSSRWRRLSSTRSGWCRDRTTC